MTIIIIIFSEESGMQFGIDKYAVLVMKKRKIVKSDGIELPREKVIKVARVVNLKLTFVDCFLI